MIQNIKEKTKDMNFDMSPNLIKTVVSLLLIILLGVLVWPSNDSKVANKPLKPKVVQSVPKPTVVANKPSKNKSKGFSEDLGGYRKATYDAIKYNTMGNYDLPAEVSLILKSEIDSLFMHHQQKIYDAYKDQRINIPKADTLSNYKLHEILE